MAENKEIEKAITLVELQNDLQGLINQSRMIVGAISYLQQKIATLSKVEDSKEK